MSLKLNYKTANGKWSEFFGVSEKKFDEMAEYFAKSFSTSPIEVLKIVETGIKKLKIEKPEEVAAFFYMVGAGYSKTVLKSQKQEAVISLLRGLRGLGDLP